MTITSQLTADIRARANFIPKCPLCSFLGGGLRQPILNGPSLRTVKFAASRDFPDGRTVVKVDSCCLFSTPQDNQFESEATAASWWRSARLQPVKDIATESRRRRTLQRLSDASLEPIE